jgi:hydrogenase/urease accessory protein HupE
VGASGYDPAMRPSRLACFLVIASLFAASARLLPASAHELLPDELILFLEENPDATEAQVRAFMETQPAIANADPEYRQRLVDTVFTAETSFWRNALAFTQLGIEHILIGTDHILFVLSLLLTFVSLRKTLKSISAFTVAHSVTLILAGFEIVTLNSRLVESMIALSIAVVAIGTVFFRRYKLFTSMESRAGMVFLFGLFHGLGFAGLLEEFSIPDGYFVSSLLFFNVGIEIGQIAVIAAALPLILVFRRRSWYPAAMKVIALLISGVALLWFVERAFDVSFMPV